MDHDTLQFYRRNAEAYAQREVTSRQARMARFLAQLAPGAKILELGCGAGGDSAEMLARGFDVRATDGSPELADIAAKRLGRPVETLLFQDVNEVEAYDAVWANACLLHVPREQLADVVARIWHALKAAGYFYASYKTGDAEGRDTLNRYYNYPSPDWLRATYAQAGNWSSLAIESGEVKGFDDKQASMLFVVARKDAEQGSLNSSQTILKIASASTACAMKPTTKASVRNTGRPSV
ncbi:class I SAM-dependent methyltransferase [Bradyrhizobium lablabi]|uniref:class I SAM-dependent methyltransferase n=1 Tax=Bradyrhizobium lablabi TaxID=722472 RepID=UPI000909E6A6|nr:Methyltransferase domain-containing protein [Bradyrhizobium lablabi]